MTRLFVVDDEPITSRWIESVVERSEFHVIGSAYDGAEALAKLPGLNADIVLTDIKMPRMDGLELIRSLRDTHPDVDIAILSSYSDFRFTSEAIRLGADDYLLKSEVSDHELLTALRRIVAARVRDSADRVSSPPDVSTPPSPPAERAGIVAELRPEIREWIAEIFRDERGIGAVISVAAALPDIGGICLSSLDHFGWSGEYRALESAGGILCARAGPESEMPERELLSALNLVYRRIGAFDLRAVRFGATISSHSPETAGAALTNAEETLQSISFYDEWADAGDRRILVFEELAANLLDLRRGAQEVLYAADMGRHREAAKLADALIARVDTGARVIASKLLDLAATLLSRLDPDIDLFGRLRTISRFSELKRLCREVFISIADPQPGDPHQTGDHVRRARDYIERNYADSQISLEHVAEYVSLTRTYFADVFHRKTGVTFHTYLSRLRLEKAESLLVNTTMRITEISRSVGFTNSSSFTRFFRRHRHETPQKFRSRMLGSGKAGPTA